MLPAAPRFVLPIIVLAQFAGTSLWFAGNAVLAGRPGLEIAPLTSAVQAGFIFGTLAFSLLSLPDRVKPVLLFLICSLIGACSNALIALLLEARVQWVYPLRLVTGIALAGIYPVGMKIAADWHPQGLGKAMGWLVGALVVGTAFPHLLKALLADANPKMLLGIISLFALGGGVLLFWLLPKPPRNANPQVLHFGALSQIWKSPGFKPAALGYLGHMWELYTFWAFLPLLVPLITPSIGHPGLTSFLVFLVIAAGAAGCIAGGHFAGKIGSSKVAFFALLGSGTCCLMVPWIAAFPFYVLLPFLLCWGFLVAADSPQLTALAAQAAPPHLKGTALAALTSAGFALTVVSLWILQIGVRSFGPEILILLAPGPLLGAYLLKGTAFPQ